MANSSLLITLLLILISTLTHSQSNVDDHKTYIVHVSKTHDPTHLTSTIHPTKLLYTYKSALHGFSARLTSAEAASFRRHPSVISLIPDLPRYPHTTFTPKFLHLSDDFGLWPTSNYADDVIIGILDTGIYPTRRSFADTNLSDIPSRWKGVCETSIDFPANSCNRKIIGARSFHRGYESNLGGLRDEEASPLDTEGHGTHTASTAAGSFVSGAGLFNYAEGEARGMAVRARIAVYKICWAFGCFDSDILAAMDQAIEDGVDVISLSVGATGYAPPYDGDSIAIGAFGAVEKGVLVSCSAGNSGPGPETGVNIAPWIVTVGASTVDREFPADVVLGDGRVLGGVSLYSGDGLPDFKVPLVYAGDAGSRYCYTGSMHASKVAGKIVVCERGGNARVEKGFAVKALGGIGMILANTFENGEELVADAHLIPATMVGETEGNTIKQYIQQAVNPTATIVFRGTVIGGPIPAPKVAAFSSRGPNHLTPEILKPDVIAPGVNILAAWTGETSPTDLDGDSRRVEFNIISGTSMSCPHVSGLAALLRSAHPDWSPAEIKSALMTTAYSVDTAGGTIKDLSTGKESNPFVFGAGHVDPNRALNPGLVYDINTKDYIAFLCSIGYSAKRIAVFVKDPTSDICSTTFSTPGNLNYPSFAVVFKSSTDAVTYKRVVKNVGGSKDAVYEVKVTAPDSVEISVSPSKLVFSEAESILSYEVTFSSVALGGVGVKGQEFGSIEWSDGEHLVRSPVAVRWVQGSVDTM